MGQKRQSHAGAGVRNPGLMFRSFGSFLDLLFDLERAAADGGEWVRSGEIGRLGHRVRCDVAGTMRELAAARIDRRRRAALRRAPAVRAPDEPPSRGSGVLATRLPRSSGARR